MSMFNWAISLLPLNDKVLAACMLFLSGSLLKFGLSILAEYLAAHVGGMTLHETRSDILKKFSKLPSTFFLDQKKGSLKHLVLLSTQRVSHCLWIVTLALIEAMKIIAILALLLVFDVYATVGIGILGLCFYLLSSSIFQRISYREGKHFAVHQVQMANVLDELLSGINIIQIFGVFGHWFKQFKKSSLRQLRHQVKQRVVINIPKSLLETSVALIAVGVIFLLYKVQALSSAESLPFLGLFGMAVMKIWPSLHLVNKSRLDLMTQLPDVEFVHCMLTTPLKEQRTGGQDLREFRSSIRFENVEFAFEGRPLLLRNLNMIIERNKITAIVGRSGEGKSTIVNLILGLYEVQKGAIFIDHINLSDLNLQSWRSHIGYVSQSSFLFHGTVLENIAFGEEYSREEIVEAAKIALVDEFVGDMENSYDTVVGEGGMKLSGGQQQRIAIARALLRKPEFLIFDEATSSLDNVSEKMVQQSIEKAAHNRTVLIIAHRLSTVQKADKIIVLEKGNCLEEGTHHQLLNNQSTYRRLVDAQQTL